MKPGKVYLKIFLSFLAVLMVTEAVIFVLFMVYAGRPAKAWTERLNAAKLALVKDTIEGIIQEKIRSEPGADLSKNEPLNRFIHRFGELFDAKVWMDSPDGKILIRSFDGVVPEGVVEKFARGRLLNVGEFQFHTLKPPGLSGLYAAIPVRINAAEEGQLHILFEKMWPPSPSHHKGFLWGLIFVGLVIAILVIPVSRLITRPLDDLKRSALQIAEGDLSHRAPIRSRDEIGELGRAFNQMADRLQGMIKGGKALTANVSHQLRSPLARIRVAAELLKEKLERGDAAGTERQLKDIQEDVEEMDRMIGQLLAFSKLDIHEAALRHDPLDLVALVKEHLERFGPMMDQKGIRTETDFHFTGLFPADRDAMSTVLTNLLDNACKYTPPNGVVRMSVSPEEKSLRLSVVNTTDRVLSEEQLERLFDPFYRVEGASPKGTGLGLAIVRKIIEKQGGAIEASQSENSICITFTLPSYPA